MKSELLDRLTNTLGQWGEPPQYAALFGSAARSTMTEKSDIDILLVRQARQVSVALDERWDDQVTQLSRDVSVWTGNDARVVEFSTDEIRAAVPLLEDVAAHGLTVFGQPAWLRRRVLARAAG